MPALTTSISLSRSPFVLLPAPRLLRFRVRLQSLHQGHTLHLHRIYLLRLSSCLQLRQDQALHRCTSGVSKSCQTNSGWTFTLGPRVCWGRSSVMRRSTLWTNSHLYVSPSCVSQCYHSKTTGLC